MNQHVDLAGYVEHFRARVLQDALNEATAAYWHRRADAFDQARSRPGDHPGRAAPADPAARDRELDTIARACRTRAALAQLQTAIDPDVYHATHTAQTSTQSVSWAAA